MKKHYYSIGEVCNLLDLKPYIIRYWELEFPDLKTDRVKGSTRRYSVEKVELLRKIREMLYVQKFTVQGVRNKLSQMKAVDKYKEPINKSVINRELKEALVNELSALKGILEEAEANCRK